MSWPQFMILALVLIWGFLYLGSQIVEAGCKPLGHLAGIGQNLAYMRLEIQELVRAAKGKS